MGSINVHRAVGLYGQQTGDEILLLSLNFAESVELHLDFKTASIIATSFSCAVVKTAKFIHIISLHIIQYLRWLKIIELKIRQNKIRYYWVAAKMVEMIQYNKYNNQ